MPPSIIHPDLTWTGGRFEPDVRVQVGADGRIEAVGALEGAVTTLRLRDRALLPGMVNAHSHAFQRGLRGQGERFPQESGSFWTWREAMYGLVERLDEEHLYGLSRQAFQEMLASGITSVGEFHYLHHPSSEAFSYAFDEVVLRAAADAGIRIVLLQACYLTGGFDEPLRGGQRHFDTQSLEAYWAQMDHLAARLSPAQRLGAVAHSIRAVPIEAVGRLYTEACRRHLVFHMHVEEQPLEIEGCLHAYGRTPMALLNHHLKIAPTFTAVHCTHTAAADLEAFLASGGGVCLCPLTEANLGDGVPNVTGILRREGRICLGSDSNARICPLEDMRWLEYAQRLAGQMRGACRDAEGHVARRLFDMATLNGARALGLRAGAIRPGFEADFFTVDLTEPQVAGWSADTLLESLIFGADGRCVSGTCVGGRWLSGGGEAARAGGGRA